MLNQQTPSVFGRLTPPYSSGQLRETYKFTLNRDIGNTLLRKAAQLVNDIEGINAGNNTSISNTSPLGIAKTYQENTLKTAIDSILNIRKSLGITKPAGTVDGIEFLQHSLDQRGSLLNLKS